jgi:hypothetical protein
MGKIRKRSFQRHAVQGPALLVGIVVLVYQLSILQIDGTPLQILLVVGIHLVVADRPGIEIQMQIQRQLLILGYHLHRNGRRNIRRQCQCACQLCGYGQPNEKKTNHRHVGLGARKKEWNGLLVFRKE